MKKRRVLFVDDEALVLKGLSRHLRPQHHEWDMEYVTSGAEAVASMERSPADAIITDMRMPGMNGAELLNEVTRRWPCTIRFILSGHADHALIERCIGATHQYLSKPCDPTVLRDILRRTFDLESSLGSSGLQGLVRRMNRLPSVPALYHEIMAKAREPDSSLEDVGHVIARDLGMTAKVLQLVNSAFFGLAQQITSPADAVAYLGLDTLRGLILSFHAFSEFAESNLAGFDINALWQHSTLVAALARDIASHAGAPARVLDESFVAGLLHDSGRIALASNFPREYATLRHDAQWQGSDLSQAEHDAFGADHAAIGAYLLGLWGLPQPVVQAIALHHAPSRAHDPSPTFSAITAVHVANALVHRGPKDGRPPPLDSQHLADLGLHSQIEAWRTLATSPPSAP